jgi:hypothetical protein
MLDLVNVKPEHLRTALVDEQAALQQRLVAMGIVPLVKNAKKKGASKAASNLPSVRTGPKPGRIAAAKDQSRTSSAASSFSRASSFSLSEEESRSSIPDHLGASTDRSPALLIDDASAKEIEAAQTKLLKEKDVWEEAGAEPALVERGWNGGTWLADAARDLLRVVDYRRTGSTSFTDLLKVLFSKALGLELDEAQKQELSSRWREALGRGRGGDAEPVYYESVLATLAETLSAVAFADLHIRKSHWCMVYDPELKESLRFHRATGVVHQPSRSSMVSAFDTGPSPRSGAVGRAVSHAMLEAERDVDGQQGIMEEDAFYLILQSSALGLRLFAHDVERIQSEIPPTADGSVVCADVCDQVGEMITAAYADDDVQEAAWCRLWSVEDGIFFFNKQSGTTAYAKPAEFAPGAGDNDIEDLLFVRCAFSDRILHSRMPLAPTPARLKLLHACDQWHSSRVFTPLIGWHCKLRPNTEGFVCSCGRREYG